MSKVPRASLSITVLDDEDYRVLVTSKNGLEAFGIFVAMIVLGRERLQQSQARQLSGSESLRFDNSKTHLLAMTHVSEKQFNRCLSTISDVARETNSEPWMYMDETQHLVIRSFFKFNTSAGWGGSRSGAGRQSTRNQDESENNHLDSNLNSTRIPSGTGTGTGTNSPLPPSGGASVVDVPDDTEPFDQGNAELAPEPKPSVKNPPELIEKVAGTADRLFAMRDYGLKVRQLSGNLHLDVLEAALLDAHAAGKTGWNYILGIYGNRMNDGRNASHSVTRSRAPEVPRAPREHDQLIKAPEGWSRNKPREVKP